MSMALLAGFIVAFPMNWWLVARHLKHGMTAVRPVATPVPELTRLAATDANLRHPGSAELTKAAASGKSARVVPQVALLAMLLLSLAAIAAGLLLAERIASMH